MVMAICSFLFMLNMGSLFFGSLGVIFALLSRSTRAHERHGKSRSGGLYHRHNCRYLHVCFPAFNMVSGGSTNLLERYYNQYMQESPMTPDNGTTTNGNTI